MPHHDNQDQEVAGAAEGLATHRLTHRGIHMTMARPVRVPANRCQGWNREKGDDSTLAAGVMDHYRLGR